MARVEGFEPSARWFGSSRSANWNYTRMYLRTLDGTRTRSICRERAVSLAIPPRGRIQITISGIDIHVKVFTSGLVVITLSSGEGARGSTEATSGTDPAGTLRG